MTKEKEKRRDDHMLQSEIEDVQLGASIVISNDEVSGVFMSDGKIEQIDLYGTEKYVCISDEQ